MTNSALKPLALLCALAFAGCDLISPPDYTVRVSGRVVDAETGEPIADVWAFVYQRSHIVVPLGEQRTGPTGRFTVVYNSGDYPHSFPFAVNDGEYYDPRYGVYRTVVQRGATVDLGDIPLTVAEPEIQ